MFKESKIYKKNVDWYEMYSGDLGFLDGLYTGKSSIYSTDFNTLGIGSQKFKKRETQQKI